MRNMLALLGAVVVAFSVGGFYRGWYIVESMPSESGRSAFRVEIDRAKLAGDVGDVARRVIRVLTRQNEETPATEPDAAH